MILKIGVASLVYGLALLTEYTVTRLAVASWLFKLVEMGVDSSVIIWPLSVAVIGIRIPVNVCALFNVSAESGNRDVFSKISLLSPGQRDSSLLFW